MKNHKLRFLMPVLLIPLLFWSGCTTDLEEAPFGVITPEDFFQTDEEILSAVMPVYNSLAKARWSDGIPHLQDVASDAIVVPTRGGDWDDGGKWRELHQHTWTYTNSPVNAGWVDAYTGVARANATIDALSKSPKSETELVRTLIAEVRVLRALFYWWLIDLYGDVPLVTDAATDPENPPSQSPRKDVFDFIVLEINEALRDLEVAPDFGRVSVGAANALLATVYLNAEVYTGTAMWQKTIDACDEVINSGNYKLMSTVKDVFAMENEGPGNTEYILTVVSIPDWGVGFFRHSATLHYSQLPSGPWNGFSVVADYYNKFDTADARIDQLLVGQQFVLGGSAVGDTAFQRDGQPLVYTVDAPIIGANESNGVRILKWPIDPNALSSGPSGNDYAIFRLSHIILAKAEAQFELGNTSDALALVNQVRERNFNPPKPLATITLDDIFNERGYELLWEGFRRQDQIRTGHFLEAWANKDVSAEYRKLFPIPQTQMDANPNLVQNPGY